jgi:transposase
VLPCLEASEKSFEQIRREQELFSRFVVLKGMRTDAALKPPLEVDPALLPDDPAVLKELIAQLFKEIQKHAGRVEQLEHQMTLLLRKLYGVRSEKFDPRQGKLFEEPAEDAPSGETPPPTTEAPPSGSAAEEESRPEEAAARTRPGAHGRRRLPDSLVRVEQIHDLTDAEKAALGGPEQLLLIGRQVTEQLEWKPSSLFVIEHVQLSYARKEQLPESGARPEEQNVITAAKPPQPIPGGLPGPGLIAQVVVSKTCDHIPWNRSERIFARHGLEISRQTTCGWSLAGAELSRPLYELMSAEALASFVLHLDDTPVNLRDAQNKVKQRTYFWTYVGDERHPFTVFDFTLDHSRDGPSKFLRNFHGYLQADAANLYDRLYTEPGRDIVEVACWMHARRKFFEARDKDRLRAETAVAWIRRLFKLEREFQERCAGEWSELALDERYARVAAERQARSLPLLADFHAWLEAEAPKVLPKNPVREGFDYTLRHWAALCRYTEHGALDIDNGAAERALRGIALGRKNWLFCASERGGRAMAIHFSMVASCLRHKLDPFAYLRDVFTRLPRLGDSPAPEQLRELLPDRWRPAVQS